MDLSSKIESHLPRNRMVILRKLSKTADRRRLPLYLVGGFVRDLLLGHANLDLDFVLEGDALSFAEAIAKRNELVVKKYAEFGTATLTFPGRIRVDLASARKEAYPVPAGLPEVCPGTIEDDLYRRDFTINSMAVRVNRKYFGTLLDPSAGLEDLRACTIRVHHSRSFSDDPTRIFRAVRFRTRYDFAMASQTLRIAREAVAAGYVEKLSPARVKNEFVHILEDLHPKEAIVALDQLGVMKRVHPRFSTRGAMKLLGKLEVCPRRKGVKHWFVMILALLDSLKLAYGLEIAKRLDFTRKETESLLKLHTVKMKMADFPSSPSGVYRLASQLPKEVLLFLMEISEDATKRTELHKYLTEYRFVKLEVTGHDLETLGVQQGPIYREVLDRTLDAKLDHGLRDKSDELAFIKKYLGRQR